MTIKEIDEQIENLKAQRQVLQEQEILNFQEQAKKNVGRCFSSKEGYYKVIGIPQREFTHNMRWEFNECQYPVFCISNNNEDDAPFYYDTIHSSAWGDGCYQNLQYSEISTEEFNAIFEKKLAEFRKTILTISIKD